MFLTLVMLSCAPHSSFEGRAQVQVVVGGHKLLGVLWLSEPDQLHLALREPTSKRVMWKIVQDNQHLVFSDLVHNEQITAPNLALVSSTSGFPFPAQAFFPSTLPPQWKRGKNGQYSLGALDLIIDGEPATELMLFTSGVQTATLTVVAYEAKQAPPSAFEVSPVAQMHQGTVDDLGLVVFRSLARSLGVRP